MKQLVFALAVFFVACPAPPPPPPGEDAGLPEVPDAGEAPLDAGELVRNLGSEVPVALDFILAFQGGMLVEDWGVDALGNVALVGAVSGSVDLDPTAGVDLRDVGPGSVPVVVVLGPDGTYRWSRAWTGRGGGPQPVRMAIAPQGDVYVMSTVTSSPAAPFDLDPTAGTQLVDTIEARRLFVVHLSPQGEYLRGFVTTSSGIVDTPGFITAGPDGRVWLTGWFQGSVDLDPSAASLVLTSGSGPVYPRKEFLAQYAADLSVQWALIPTTRSINNVSAFDGGALFIGTAGGGSDYASLFDADLDWGAGVDLYRPACLVRGGSSDCQPQSYFGRMTTRGDIEWTATYATVSRNRAEASGTSTSGGPIANPRGEGLVLGVTRDTVDFDWTSAELVYDAPWHANDAFFDVFAQGVTPDGRPRRLTRTRTLKTIQGLNEATWTSGAWSERDATWFATGWTQGAIIFPAVSVAGIGRPAESFLAAFDPQGGLRWATGLGVGIALGGGGAAQVRSSPSGRSFLLGAAVAGTDVDFTTGVTTLDAGTTYLIGFHPTPCVEGTMRACTCLLQVEQGVTAGCVAGRPEPCACSQENLRTDGTIPPRPTPDCGVCAAGWLCDPATWLCTDAQQVTLAGGLDHPTAVVDDGVHVYYSLQGRYPRSFPPGQYPVGEVWRMQRDGGQPTLLADAGAVSGLSLSDGYVYWAQQGIKRTATGGDGTVETIVVEPTLVGPLAFSNGQVFGVRGNQVWRYPLDGGVGATSGVIQSINAIRGVSVDSQNVYALTEGANFGGLYRLAQGAFGSGGWQRQAIAQDPRAMVQLGSAIYFSDVNAPAAITRFDTVTQQTSAAVGPMPGVINTLFTDGAQVYFTRYGLPAARTWTGEVWRLEPGGAPPTLLASSIQHAAGAFVRDGRVLVAEHGETRATTTTGSIRASPIR